VADLNVQTQPISRFNNTPTKQQRAAASGFSNFSLAETRIHLALAQAERDALEVQVQW
jgi:hypothetical protein